MIICPQCQTKYKDDETLFCGKCGLDMRTVTLTPPPGTALPIAEPRDDGNESTEPIPKLAADELDSDAVAVAAPDDAEGEDPLVGRVVDGRYRIVERIGQGGMGVVYRCEHVAMGKQAAMKVLHPTLSPRGDLGRRFRREAEAVSRLSHPSIVQVFDFGQARGGLMYLVLELVKGGDLGSILKRDGHLPFLRGRPLLWPWAGPWSA